MPGLSAVTPETSNQSRASKRLCLDQLALADGAPEQQRTHRRDDGGKHRHAEPQDAQDREHDADHSDGSRRSTHEHEPVSACFALAT